MSDEDSLSEMNVSPAKLMPKSPSLPEHHRILGLSAVQHGHSISTFKAHKIRIDDIEEKIEEFDGLKDAVRELKHELEAQKEQYRKHADQIDKSTTNLGVLVGNLSDKYAANSTAAEVKKVAIQGLVAVLIAAITAYGGYTLGHKPDATYEPQTKAQIQETAEKIKAFDPDNVKREVR